MKKLLSIFLVLVLLLSITACSTDVDNSSSDSSSSAVIDAEPSKSITDEKITLEEIKAAATKFETNKSIDMDGLFFLASDVITSDLLPCTMDGFAYPVNDGKQFVFVVSALVNESSVERQFLSEPKEITATIYYDGDVYKTLIYEDSKYPLAGKTVYPIVGDAKKSDIVTGFLVFELPKEAKSGIFMLTYKEKIYALDFTLD